MDEFQSLQFGLNALLPETVKQEIFPLQRGKPLFHLLEKSRDRYHAPLTICFAGALLVIQCHVKLVPHALQLRSNRLARSMRVEA